MPWSNIYSIFIVLVIQISDMFYSVLLYIVVFRNILMEKNSEVSVKKRQFLIELSTKDSVKEKKISQVKDN